MTRASVLAWLRSDAALGLVVLVGLALGAVFIVHDCSRPAVVKEATKVETHQAVDRHEVAADQFVARVEDHQQRVTVRHRVVRREEHRSDGAVVVTVATTDERTDAAGTTATAATETATAATDTHATLDRKEEHTREERRQTGNRVTLAPGWNEVRARPSEVSLEYSRRALGAVWLGAWVRGDVDALCRLRPRGAVGLSLAVEW